MISGVHHVGFSTPDIERLIAFYRDVVGFELALRIEHGTPSGQLDKMVEMDGVTSRMAMLRAGNVFLELIQFNTPPGRPRPADWKIADHGIGHIGLLVDDIDAESSRASKPHPTSTTAATAKGCTNDTTRPGSIPCMRSAACRAISSRISA